LSTGETALGLVAAADFGFVAVVLCASNSKPVITDRPAAFMILDLIIASSPPKTPLYDKAFRAQLPTARNTF
jgi:hypothetical protein